MAVYNPYQAYANNPVSSKPEDLTLMLYDGAIKFGNLAKVAIEKKDYPSAHKYIIRVQDIIREFQITLDRQYPISEEFDRMYDYIYRRLVTANIEKNVEILDECIDLIREFRDTWKEVIRLVREEKKGNAPTKPVQSINVSN